MRRGRRAGFEGDARNGAVAVEHVAEAVGAALEQGRAVAEIRSLGDPEPPDAKIKSAKWLLSSRPCMLSLA